jgi:hypothetical protein
MAGATLNAAAAAPITQHEQHEIEPALSRYKPAFELPQQQRCLPATSACKLIGSPGLHLWQLANHNSTATILKC